MPHTYRPTPLNAQKTKVIQKLYPARHALYKGVKLFTPPLRALFQGLVMIKITPFKLKIDHSVLFSKTANIRLGNSVFVAGYRNRMRRGLGVDNNGNPVRHKPLKENDRVGNRGSRATPLVNTGRMVKAFRVNRGRTAGRLLVMDFPEKEKKKAATHQFGNPRKNIPARPHVGASSNDLKKAVLFLENFWKRSLDKFIRIEKG